MAVRSARKNGDRPKGGAGRRVGWGLIFVVCIVWSFVLGILVGQGNLATREQIDRLTEHARTWPLVGVFFEPEPEQDQPPQEVAKLKLEFYERLQNGTQAETPPVVRPAPPAAAETPRPAASPATPEAPPAETRPDQRRYTVQVASFATQAQAVELVMRLRGSGLNAYVLAAKLKGVGMRYRVRVGDYGDFEEAQTAAGRIRLEEKLAAFVTRKE